MSVDGRRWLRIARNDVQEARRDRTLLGIGVLFVLVGILMGYLLSQISGFTDAETTVSVLFLQLMGVLVPLTAVGVTYERVVGRRVDGSLKLILGMPYLRRDVVLGSYVGRTVVTVAVTIVGFVALLIAGVLFGAGVPSGLLPVQALALTVALGIVFTGIALTVSCATSTTTRASMVTFLVTVVMLFLWGLLVTGLIWIVNGFQGMAGPEPAWATFLQTVNPVNAFKAIASTMVPTFDGPARLVSGETVYQSLPWAVGIMAFWAVVVPILGYLRFRAADL
jgi:ABC-type transport system involved in multi-copper enzyme maturation permease subunit